MYKIKMADLVQTIKKEDEKPNKTPRPHLDSKEECGKESQKDEQIENHSCVPSGSENVLENPKREVFPAMVHPETLKIS